MGEVVVLERGEAEVPETLRILLRHVRCEEGEYIMLEPNVVLNNEIHNMLGVEISKILGVCTVKRGISPGGLCVSKSRFTKWDEVVPHAVTVLAQYLFSRHPHDRISVFGARYSMGEEIERP